MTRLWVLLLVATTGCSVALGSIGGLSAVAANQDSRIRGQPETASVSGRIVAGTMLGLVFDGIVIVRNAAVTHRRYVPGTKLRNEQPTRAQHDSLRPPALSNANTVSSIQPPPGQEHHLPHPITGAGLSGRMILDFQIAQPQ